MPTLTTYVTYRHMKEFSARIFHLLLLLQVSMGMSTSENSIKREEAKKEGNSHLVFATQEAKEKKGKKKTATAEILKASPAGRHFFFYLRRNRTQLCVSERLGCGNRMHTSVASSSMGKDQMLHKNLAYLLFLCFAMLIPPS